RPFAGRVALDQRVEVVLRRQCVAHGGGTQRDADDAPAHVAARRDLVEKGRLVRAVERAEAEVDHALGELLAGVAGPFDRRVEIVEKRARQAPGHSLYAALTRL